MARIKTITFGHILKQIHITCILLFLLPSPNTTQCILVSHYGQKKQTNNSLMMHLHSVFTYISMTFLHAVLFYFEPTFNLHQFRSGYNFAKCLSPFIFFLHILFNVECILISFPGWDWHFPACESSCYLVI